MDGRKETRREGNKDIREVQMEGNKERTQDTRRKRGNKEIWM